MRKAYLFIAAVVFLLLSSLIFAQAPTGASLSGVVTDQTGAALREVAVTIKNVDTGATRTIATDGGGRFQASGLPSGRFEIRAAKQGFAYETPLGISLAVGQDAAIDIRMQRNTPDPCASGHEFATTDCTLTWHGITVYGAYDVGAGWVSHGLPENGYNYEGESLAGALCCRGVTQPKKQVLLSPLRLPTLSVARAMHTARFGYWETCTWLKDWNKRPIHHGVPREFSRFARVTGYPYLIL